MALNKAIKEGAKAWERQRPRWHGHGNVNAGYNHANEDAGAPRLSHLLLIAAFLLYVFVLKIMVYSDE